ncbi:hypothetical protein [Pseudoxanthomonas putridarboris]|uniref:Uncharacterized protein n=1 Tax=Pseudoxanthomonas putridarboris TaxID=752605 RepID=A0ABU9IWX8_9GAMM
MASKYTDGKQGGFVFCRDDAANNPFDAQYHSVRLHKGMLVASLFVAALGE